MDLSSLLIGKKLKNEDLKDEKFNVFWGLPILSSDAISSVAYAGEEMLWVLMAVVGIHSYKYMFYASLAIIILLLLLVLSYKQTIDAYPNGGGSYIVAKENLGEKPGLIAASSLIIDYILTVAVSICAGTAAITSAFPSLLNHKITISVFLIIIMTIGNLRGLRDSSKLFGIPTYFFIFSILIMIITGIVKVYILGYTPTALYAIPKTTGYVTLFLMIKTFASGCTALTGVEAVSNGVPNFKEPSQKNAKMTLNLLGLSVLVIFGGLAFLTTIYHAVPNFDNTVISQISLQVFGKGFMYYIVQATTAIILIMAANTSFAGLPLLLSLLACDKYVPRQFSKRGGRLSFSNGIVLIGILASLLVIIFKGETHLLIPLYAVGVFVSFTLSQTGMLKKWIKAKSSKWIRKSAINGLGAVLSLITVINICITKFQHGAWIVCILIPFFVYCMLITKKHYINIAKQLQLLPEEIEEETNKVNVDRYAIVLIDTLNKASYKSINYAKKAYHLDNIVAFHISISAEEDKKLRDKWKKCNINIPLIIKYSPYRDIIGTMMEYVESEEHSSKPGDIINVVIGQFVVSHFWQNIFHNQTGLFIKQRLLKDEHIAVVTVPYTINDLD